VTDADLRDVSDAKEEALRQWDARLSAIFEEYETQGPACIGGIVPSQRRRIWRPIRPFTGVFANVLAPSL